MGVRGREAGRKDEEVQGSFAKGIDEELDILASYFAKTPAEDQDDMPASARERAVHLLSELVGAIILARAVAQANLSLSHEFLEPVPTPFQTPLKPPKQIHEHTRIKT